MLVATFGPAKSLDDGMQVQCLPVYKAETPQWTYRKVPRASSFRTFANVPFWCRKPQPFTYYLRAEDLTKSTFVPSLPEDDLQVLKDADILPLSPLLEVDIVSRTPPLLPV